jgi:hypothetical protein
MGSRLSSLRRKLLRKSQNAVSDRYNFDSLTVS